jgi:hypothetical protein
MDHLSLSLPDGVAAASANGYGEPPFVDVVTFEVSCFPADAEERRHFKVMVAYRGRDLWAVTDGFGQCLNTDGEWDWEMRSTEREDDWLSTHRFTLDDAIRRAREIAPTLTVNGWTVEDRLLGRDHPTGGRHGG